MKSGCDTERHAYLVMAHHEFELLKTLLLMLDFEMNDIYVYVDANSAFPDSLRAEMDRVVKKGRLFWANRQNITWGGYSQIACELSLLKMATKTHHQYYHLLSGCDLPIKKNEEIVTFFRENAGKIFLACDKNDAKWSYKVSQYHFFSNIVGKRRCYFLRGIDFVSRRVQSILRVNRCAMDGKCYGKGANWFSIPEDFALYVLENKEMIATRYCYTICADEIFMQTLLLNSSFVDRHVNDCLRYIDWNRGTPYTFQEGDWEEIRQSSKLWARKFSENVSGNLPKRIKEVYLEESSNYRSRLSL